MNKFISFCDNCLTLFFTEKEYNEHNNKGHNIGKLVTVDKVEKKEYNRTMKKITINIEKTKDGYILASQELGKIMYFDDTDKSRKDFIVAAGHLMMDLLNHEIENGNKYL